MATSKIQILIEADDKAGAKLKALAAGLEDVGKKGTKSAFNIKDAMKGVTAALAGAAAVVGVFKKAMDFAKEGAQLQRLESAGDKMATSFDQNMDDLVGAIQRATNGAIPEFEAMGLANRALLLGVAETPEQFTKLATAAAALGQAMDRTSSEAMTDIVTGIGRMSPLILDNLGIMTRGGKVFDEYAASVGKTADQLTDTERKQILLNSALEAAGPLLSEDGKIVADNATSWEAFDAQIKDTTDDAKNWLADGLTPWLSGFQAMNRAIDEQEKNLLDLAPTYEEYLRMWDDQSFRMRTLGDQLSRADFQAQKFASSGADVSGGWHRGLAEIEPALEEVTAAVEAFHPPSIWDEIFPSPADLAQKLQDQIDFVQAGGPGLVAAMENIQSALTTGAITPEQAEEMLKPISAAASGLAIEMGDTDIWAAAKERAHEFGIPFDEARKDILAGIAGIESIPQEIDIRINWIMENPIPGMQHGGPVWPGQPFLVGERGPELFLPPSAGSIVNNNDTRNLSFGNVNINNGQDLSSFQSMLRRSLGGE